MNSDLTIPGELLERLSRFGRVCVFDTVTSTNDEAFSLAGGHEAAIVIANHQTKGRGRFGRPWHSDSDSLTFSVLLFSDNPKLPPSQLIPHVAGLALSLTIEKVTGLKTLIRWPNDIMHDDKKLAGILCEGRRGAIAVGIGLNVNQAAFPDDLPEAGSIRSVTGKEHNRLALFEQFMAELTDWLDRTGAGGASEFWSAVKERSGVLHRRVEVSTMLRRHIGVVSDINTEGSIVLRTDGGRIVVLNSGQVRRLR